MPEVLTTYLLRAGAARALLSVALFLAVAGARFWLIARYATAMPYWDQWDGIGARVLKPWLEGRLDLPTLFAAHNEHRIVLTRLLSLGIFAANGQWDGALEMAVNALGCGIGAAALANGLVAALGGAWQRSVFLAVGVCWTLPFGWENTLGGFQSQNYFLIFFSLLAIWGLAPCVAGSARWWVGLAGLALAGLSMASGFLAALAVLAMGGGRLAAERRRPLAGEWITAGVCAAAVAAGWLTRVDVPATAALKAESAAAFLSAAGRFLAWPWYGSPWGAAIAFLPALGLAWHYSKGTAPPGAEFLLTISGWCVLQTAALAYGRGGHAAPPACRYMDLLAVGPLVNFVILLWFADGSSSLRSRGAAVIWTALLLTGLARETSKDFNGWLPGFRAQMQRSESNAAGYIRTHDFGRYLAGKTVRDIPYPDPVRLAALLDDPTLRTIFPSDLREPLALRVSTPGGHSPFNGLSEGLKTWESSAYRSMTLQADCSSTNDLPYLTFYFLCDLGADHPHFRLRKNVAGAPWSEFRLSRRARGRWHADVLTKPARDFQLEATAGSPTSRFAFSAPTEVGFWSYWSAFAMRRGGESFGASLVLAGAACLIQVRVGQRRRTS